MKRNILSVLLACLMIVSLCLMVGCKTDDLEAQIQENDAKQEGAVSDLAADLESDIKSAADTAAANLAEAQKKLEAMISSGDAVDAAALKAATAEFNAALAAAQDALNATIDAAVEDATEAYTALEASLEKAIDDAVAAVAAATEKKIGDLDAALKDAIAEGDSLLSVKVNSVAAELALLQETVLRDMVALDTILKQDLTDKFNAALEALYEDLYYYIEDLASDLEDAVATLEKADADNKKAAEDALAAAIAEYTKKIGDLNTALETLDGKVDTTKTDLQAEIDADVTKAVTDLTAYIDGEIADLKSDLQAEIDADVAKAVTDLTALIEGAKTLAQQANDTLKTELQKEIDDDVAAAVKTLNDRITTEVATLNTKINTDVAKAVTDLTALIESAKTLAQQANDTLKTELQKEIDDDVAAAVKTLNDRITNEVATLNTKIDTDVAKAVTDLTALIEGAKTLAQQANDTLKTELQAEIDADVKDAYDTLKAYIDDEIADLKTALQAEIDADVEDAVDALELAIEAAKTLADEANTALKATIDADIAAVTTRIDLMIEGWTDATEDAAEAVIEINTIYSNLVLGLPEAAKLPVSNLYEAAKVRVLRALDATAVATALAEYKAAVDSIEGVVAIYKAKVLEYILYYVDEQKDIDALFAKAIKDIVVKGADVAALEAKFDADVKAVKTKAKVILATFDALGGALVDKVEYTTAWNNAITDAENDILAETDPAVTGNAEFAAMVAVIGDLRDRYIQIEGKVAGEAIADKMVALNQRVPVVYNNTVLEADVIALRAEYDAWYAALPTNPGLVTEVFGEELTKFEAIEDRIAKLDTALIAAEGFNTRITALIAAIKVTTVSSVNKVELEKLINETAAWVDMYFAAPYADEAVAGNTNYDMVAWDDLAQAKADFAAAAAKFEEVAGKYVDAVENIPAVIDLFAGDEITYAINAYLTATGNLGSYDNIFVELFGKTADAVYTDLVAKKTAYDNLVVAALAEYTTAYAAIEDYLNGTKLVDIYTTEFKTMLKWFEDYAVEDASGYVFQNVSANGETLAAGYDIGFAHVITAEKYAEYVAFQDKVNTLVAAKLAEIEAVEDIINAIGTVVVGLDSAWNKTDADKEGAIKAAEDAYLYFLNGTSSLRPDGFTADQFKTNGSSTYEISAALLTVLNDARADYNALKAEADTIKAYIEGLDANTVSGDIADTTERDAYKTALDKAVADIATFETKNGADNVVFDEAKLTAGYLAIARFEAAEELKAYFVATADADVNDYIDALYAQALAAINAAETFDDIKALAKAKYDAMAATGYIAALAAVVDAYSIDALEVILGVEANFIYNATTVDGADDYAAIANAKYTAVVDVHAKYTNAVTNIYAVDPAYYSEADVAQYGVDTIYKAQIDAIVDAADATFVVDVDGKFDAIVTVLEKYVANEPSIPYVELKDILLEAFEEAVDAVVAGADVATTVADTVNVYVALVDASNAYTAADGVVATLAGVYTDAKVYNVAVAELAKVYDALADVAYNDLAGIKLADEKFDAIVTAIGYFETAYLTVDKDLLETAFGVELEKITDAEGGLTVILENVKDRFNGVGSI